MKPLYQRYHALFGPGVAAFYAMRDDAETITVSVVGQDGSRGSLRVSPDGVDEIVAALMAAKVSKPLPEPEPKGRRKA